MSDKQLVNESWNDPFTKGLIAFLRSAPEPSSAACQEQRRAITINLLSLFRISSHLSLPITVESNHRPVIVRYPRRSYLMEGCVSASFPSQLEYHQTMILTKICAISIQERRPINRRFLLLKVQAHIL